MESTQAVKELITDASCKFLLTQMLEIVLNKFVFYSVKQELLQKIKSGVPKADAQQVVSILCRLF